MSDKENVPGPSKKPKLSLSLKKNRFKASTSEEISALETYQMPKTTGYSSRWALKTLRDWFDDFQERNPDSPCPHSLLTPTATKEVLNKYLTVFIAEARSQNGDRYPPRTIYSLLTGILRWMRTQNASYPNFLDKKDPAFSTFRTGLDNLFKQLKSNGVGSDSQHTENISSEEENQLWMSGTLNVTTPKGLLRAVFFICGKCFCLRGGEEHRNLSVYHFKRLSKPDRYCYTEHSSKNRPGGIEELQSDHKAVTIFANPAVGDRCPVLILDKYIAKLPANAFEKAFYCKPLASTPTDESKPWFTAVPVGKNLLSKMVAEMCAEAGVVGKKTNHSLRVAGATTLFDAGVPERIIQQRTGHKSVGGLRTYERVTEDQQKMVSKILSGQSKKFNESLSAQDEITPHCDSRDDNVKPARSVLGELKPPCLQSPTAPQYNNCNINFYSSAPPSPYPAYGQLYPPPANFPQSWPQCWQPPQCPESLLTNSDEQ